MPEDNETVVEEVNQNENIESNDEQSSEENIELDIAFDGDTPTPNEDDEFEDTENQTEVFRNLRTKHKETSKELKKLRKEVELLKSNPTPVAQQEEAIILPNKPKLEQFDYDEESFDKAMEEYYDKKTQIEAKKKEQEQSKIQEEQKWQSKLTTYIEESKKLNVPDYSEREEIVKEKLTQVQQGILLDVIKNPAQFVYALGKSSKLNDLSNISNPILFAAELARLETQIKVNNKTQRTPPPPEKIVRGTSGGMTDTKLELLRKEAEKTGDFSKVFAYKKQINK